MAASSSLSSSFSLLPLFNSSSISPSLKPSLSFLLQAPKPLTSLSSRRPSSRVLAAPELMESQETLDEPEGSGGLEVEGAEVTGTSALSVGADAETLFFSNSPRDPYTRPGKQLHSSPNEVSSMSRQRIIIRNSSGENLVGIIDDAGSRDVVILCHGFRSSKESKTLVNLADALTKERVSVFCFDFAGNGDSEGLFQYGNYWKEVEDLRSVILYFLGKKLDVKAIIGHSKGGNVVLLYASLYKDVYTVVNISGRFFLERGIEERLGKDFMEKIQKDGFIDVMDKAGKFMYCVTKESLMERLSTDMRSACLSIDQNCRVLTVHGSQDEIVPPTDALEFAKSIINHKLHIVEGADHRYLSHQFQLARTLLEFIRFNVANNGSIQ